MGLYDQKERRVVLRFVAKSLKLSKNAVSKAASRKIGSGKA